MTCCYHSPSWPDASGPDVSPSITAARSISSSTMADCGRFAAGLAEVPSQAAEAPSQAAEVPSQAAVAVNPPPQCWQYTNRPSSLTRIRRLRPQTGQF